MLRFMGSQRVGHDRATDLFFLWMKSHPESQHRKPINPRYPRAPKGQVYKPQIELYPPILCIRKQVHSTPSYSTGAEDKWEGGLEGGGWAVGGL